MVDLDSVVEVAYPRKDCDFMLSIWSFGISCIFEDMICNLYCL